MAFYGFYCYDNSSTPWCALKVYVIVINDVFKFRWITSILLKIDSKLNSNILVCYVELTIAGEKTTDALLWHLVSLEATNSFSLWWWEGNTIIDQYKFSVTHFEPEKYKRLYSWVFWIKDHFQRWRNPKMRWHHTTAFAKKEVSTANYSSNFGKKTEICGFLLKTDDIAFPPCYLKIFVNVFT